MTLKEEIFELRGKLHVEVTRMEINERALRNNHTRADKIARELELLENKFIQRHRFPPNFSK